MPRWFFILCVAALVLSVIGGMLIVLRSPGDRVRADGPAPVPQAATPVPIGQVTPVPPRPQ